MASQNKKSTIPMGIAVAIIAVLAILTIGVGVFVFMMFGGHNQNQAVISDNPLFHALVDSVWDKRDSYNTEYYFLPNGTFFYDSDGTRSSGFGADRVEIDARIRLDGTWTLEGNLLTMHWENGNVGERTIDISDDTLTMTTIESAGGRESIFEDIFVKRN